MSRLGTLGVWVLVAAALGAVTLGASLAGPVSDSLKVSSYFTYPKTTRPDDGWTEIATDIRLPIAVLDEGDTLSIAMYSFTDNRFGSFVLRAFEEGADVRIFQEEDQTCQKDAEAERLATAGIPYRVDGHSGVMHHKFAVINNRKVITGSYNWSDAAHRQNWENIVVIESAEIAQGYQENFKLMWANGTPFAGCP